MYKRNVKKVLAGIIVGALMLNSFILVENQVKGAGENLGEEAATIVENLEASIPKVEEIKAQEVVSENNKVEIQGLAVPIKPTAELTSVNVPNNAKLIIKDGGAFAIEDGGVTTPSLDTVGPSTSIVGNNYEIELQNSQEVIVNKIESTGNLKVTGSGSLKASSADLKPIEVRNRLEVSLSGGVLTAESKSPSTPNSYGVYAGWIDVRSGTLSAIADTCIYVENDINIYLAGKISATIIGASFTTGIDIDSGHLIVDGGEIEIDSQSNVGGVGIISRGTGFDIKRGGRVAIGQNDPSKMNFGILGTNSSVLEVKGLSTGLYIHCLAQTSRSVDLGQVFVEDDARMILDSGYQGMVIHNDLQATDGAYVYSRSVGEVGITTNDDHLPSASVPPGIYVDNAIVYGTVSGSTATESYGIYNKAGGFVVQNGGSLEGIADNGNNQTVDVSVGILSGGVEAIVDNGTVIGESTQTLWSGTKYADGIWNDGGIKVKNGGSVTGTGGIAGLRLGDVTASENSEIVGDGGYYGIGATEATISDTATVTGTGMLYGTIIDGDVNISGGVLKGTGADGIVGAGVMTSSGGSIISTGGHVIGESLETAEKGVQATGDIIISNKGIVEGTTPSFGDKGLGTAYTAVVAAGTFTVSGEGKVIENYGVVEDFADTYIDPGVDNPNMGSFANYDWQVGDGALDFDAMLGVRAVNTIVGNTALTATRIDGSGEPIALSGNSSHIINYFATLRGTQYQMSFDLNGGDVAATPQPQLIKAGVLVVEPPTPVRAGYKFLGWKESSSGGYWSFSQDQMPARAVVLYAQWEQIASGGSGSASGGNQKAGGIQGTYRIPKTGGYAIVAGAAVLIGVGALLLKKKKN